MTTTFTPEEQRRINELLAKAEKYPAEGELSPSQPGPFARCIVFFRETLSRDDEQLMSRYLSATYPYDAPPVEVRRAFPRPLFESGRPGVRGGLWLTHQGGPGTQPHVRTTATANEWEYVWPDASGGGNDAVRKIRPEDVANLFNERDQLATKVRELETERVLERLAEKQPLAKLYRFDVDKQVAKRSNPGKPEWSQTLRVNISRREAIDVMRKLLNQMTRERSEEH